MNKVACAAIAVASFVGVAVAGEELISSANIVGYQLTLCEKGKWYLMASQFSQIGSAPLTINEALKGNITPTSDTATAPVAQMWNGADYDIYSYLDYAYDEEWHEYYDGCWATAANEYSTAVVAPGTGIWFRDDNESVTITFAGEVVAADTMPKTLVANKFNLLANPYPMALSINDAEQVAWGDIAPTSDTSTAPVLQVWNGTDYDIYSYLDYAYDSEWHEYYDGCWATAANEYVETPIGIGAGFWVKPTSEITVTFKK